MLFGGQFLIGTVKHPALYHAVCEENRVGILAVPDGNLVWEVPLQFGSPPPHFPLPLLQLARSFGFSYSCQSCILTSKQLQALTMSEA